MGAAEAVGYDIDEWSVDNARHNAVINRVDDRFTALEGDAGILSQVEGTFDVVVANINRNILLNDLPTFVGKMSPQATLLMSGFYDTDVTMLTERAATLGLQKVSCRQKGDWTCLGFVRTGSR
jgi:ribosomal protein L11 methyltransferase